MHAKRNWLLAAALMALFFPALVFQAAAQPPELTQEVITEKDLGRSFLYKVGQKFAVDLPDPGDGFQCQEPVFDPKVLKLLGRQTIKSPEPKPGEVGRVRLSFEAVGPGKTQLAVSFAKPGDKSVEPMELLRVNVRVTK